MIKNCNNCTGLDYYLSEVFGETSGNFCNNRQYDTESHELKHLQQLQDETYLYRAKKCCVLKPDGAF